MKTIQWLVLLVLTAGLSVPSAALAGRPRSLPVRGMVQTVNMPKREITLIQDNGKVRTFCLSKDALFTTGGQPAFPSDLKSGMHIEVNLRNPVFGPDYVTRVKRISTAEAPKK